MNQIEEARQELQREIRDSVLRFEQKTGLTPLSVRMETAKFLDGTQQLMRVEVGEFALHNYLKNV